MPSLLSHPLPLSVGLPTPPPPALSPPSVADTSRDSLRREAKKKRKKKEWEENENLFVYFFTFKGHVKFASELISSLVSPFKVKSSLLSIRGLMVFLRSS